MKIWKWLLGILAAIGGMLAFGFGSSKRAKQLKKDIKTQDKKIEEKKKQANQQRKKISKQKEKHKTQKEIC